MSHQVYIEKTRMWVEKFILGLNLCPFAHKPYQKNRVRIVVSEARDENELVRDLLPELLFMYDADPDEWETSLLVHPHCLTSWDDFWDFLEIAEEMVQDAGLEGVFQLVGFHPNYLFGGEDPADASHFTNRSPFPLIHILREESISRAVETHGQVKQIPIENMAKLRSLGQPLLHKKLQDIRGNGE